GCRLIHQTWKKQTCLCSCCNRRTVHLMDEIEFSEIVDGWLCTLVAEPVELAEESNADIEELEFQVPGPLYRFKNKQISSCCKSSAEPRTGRFMISLRNKTYPINLSSAVLQNMIWSRSVQLAENKAHMDDLRPLNYSRDAQDLEKLHLDSSSSIAYHEQQLTEFIC
ncbi:unnamed protein product, partial [Musa acuminata subsp. burmannicoides]